MTRHIVVALSATLLAGSVGGAVATGAAPQQKAPEFTGATTAILVDVVVRDRKNHPVADLAADDFAVLEDGVRQKIDTFSRVTRGGGIGLDVRWKQPGSTVAVLPPGSVPPPSPDQDAADEATTALVFDHLSDEALNLARAYSPRGAEVERLERTRAELLDSYAQVRYAQLVSANF